MGGRFFMAKYSFELKKKIVEAYLNNEGGYGFLAQKYGIPSKSYIKGWIDNYKTFGDAGLMRSRKQQTFSFEFKLSVVELYLTTEISYQELALKVGITNPAQIGKWVNDYRVAGPDALIPRKKGRPKPLKKPNAKTIAETPNGDAVTEYIKQLEEENLKLRIQNAYLKELRRLRLEDEARMRELQESSTVSEENSD